VSGKPVPTVDTGPVVRGLGVENVWTVDPNLFRPTEKALREAIEAPGVSVVIAKAPCVLVTRERNEPFAVDVEKCNACGICVRLGCPAISRDENSRARIDTEICIGCRQCVQVCRVGAIRRTGRTCEAGGAA